jgi:hypothetical protein
MWSPGRLLRAPGRANHRLGLLRVLHRPERLSGRSVYVHILKGES